MTNELLSQQEASCQGVIYSVLQRSFLRGGGAGLTVALVSAHPGAGTTHLTLVMSRMLERDAAKSVFAVNGRALTSVCAERDKPSQGVALGNGSTRLSVPAFEGSWRGRPDHRAEYLSQLREQFRYVLIDCPSLKESADVLSLAPLVDGVLLVVEADRTRKDQLAYLERTIEGAGGQIYGHLLNKRSYPIPTWLHGQLERWGV